MQGTMKAAVYEGEGVLTVKEVVIPQVRKDTDVLIRVDAASICGSDLHGLTIPPGVVHTPNIIYGHEFCGTVVEKGSSVEAFEIGDFVTVNPRVRCGHCYECTHNRGDLCSETYHYGETGDGGFAEYALVDAGQMYRVRKSANDVRSQIGAFTVLANAKAKAAANPGYHVYDSSGKEV